MASLRRKTGSKYWFACFTLPSGQQTQRSTKEVTRSKAQIVADTYERITREQRSEGQVRKVITDLHEILTGQRLSSSSLREYYNRFLEQKKLGCSKATLSKYRQVVGEFVDRLEGRADRDINFVTVDDVIRFRDWYASRLSAATTNVSLKCIRAFLQAAWRSGLVTENVAAKVETLKLQRGTVKKGFTLDEVERVFTVAGDSEWRGIILCGLTGQRIGDIATLKWTNVHGLEGDKPYLAFKTRKTGRAQRVPILPALAEYLAELPTTVDDPHAPIFPKANAVMMGEDRSGTLSNQFYELLVLAGLASPRVYRNTGRGRSTKRRTNELSFHSFRHTATSMMKLAGVPESVAKDLIGHDTTAMSDHYTYVDDQAKRDALALLPFNKTRSGNS